MIPTFKLKHVSSVGLSPDVRRNANELTSTVNSQRIRPGLGILVDQTSEGTTVRIDPQYVASIREQTKGRWL
jgi:hypothetical protein